MEPHAKYCCPNTCIGPEFIVRATKPSKVIHIKGVKVRVPYLENSYQDILELYGINQLHIYACGVSLWGKCTDILSDAWKK
jgi:hypothetical protein